MALVNKEELPTDMITFLNYWKSNLKDMGSATKDKLDIAWLYCYNKKRTGSSCSSCLVNVYGMLKAVYEANKSLLDVPVIKVEETIIEPPKKKNTKTGFDLDTKNVIIK